MSALPEWLWPLEDEEAVQEAERLIEETHSTLQRMEADMRVQRISGQHLSQQAEKLKSVVNSKINFLEKELKTLSEPTRCVAQCQEQHVPDKSHKLKLTQKVNEALTNQQQVLNLPRSRSKPCSKVSVVSSAVTYNQLPSQATSSCHSLSKQGTNVVSKKNTSTAEKVVLTARAKVQDALAVARNVSASLEQHVSASSLHGKPVTLSQINNIGVFEVKSQADEKREDVSKKRLEQTSLPSISIKRGLEKQSIPSVQVAPGQKLVAANVSVFNMKYDHEVNRKEPVNSKDRTSSQNLQFSSVEHQSANYCSNTNAGFEGAFTQLSKQLADVEELREVNQTQVNHVLRFLLSRVCTTADTPERSNTSPASQDEESKLQSKQVVPPPQSTSTSESSQYPIAYDSLSRFLETYKRAAEQSMLARKRAAVRKQKVAVHQRKEVQKVQNSTGNHLLIGPLRQTAKLKSDSQQVESPVQESMDSLTISSSLHQQVNFKENEESNTSSIIEAKNDNENVSAEIQQMNFVSPQESSKTSSDVSPVLFPLKSPGTLSGEEYEDDWEEEENAIVSPKSVEGKGGSTESFLRPIIEAEENVSSLSQSVNEKSILFGHSPGSFEENIQTLNINSVKNLTVEMQSEEKISEKQVERSIATAAINMQPEEKISEEQTEEPIAPEDVQQPMSSRHNGEGDAFHMSEFRHHGITMVKCGDDSGKLQLEKEPSNDGASLSESENTEDSDKPVHKSAPAKVTHATHLRKEMKGKQHQTVRRKTPARLHNLHSSSSDAEVHNDLKPAPHNSKRWDLNLREDLQLQSAILLNWQMEDRLKRKSNDASTVKDQAASHSLQCEIAADIEKRWQRTLDKLDHRLKTIEENERIHRIANEIQLQSRQGPSTHTVIGGVKNVTGRFQSSDTGNLIEMKVPTKDQMVQTSPEKNKLATASKNFEQLLVSTPKQQKKAQIPQDFEKVGFGPIYSNDLTEELLAYSRMGILPRLEVGEQFCSKSSSSSTTSSHLHQSSLLVSLSDGELRDSGSGSCSCSEGEFCICGGRKLCSERAPPDGSQTLSDGENFMKDVSQGEIPLNEFRDMLKDASYGEITNHNSTGYITRDHQAQEESLDSDGIEWEHR